MSGDCSHGEKLAGLDLLRVYRKFTVNVERFLLFITKVHDQAVGVNALEALGYGEF